MDNKFTDPSSERGMVRQLAAVMFTDMSGYTAMMHENEQRARDLMNRQQQVLEHCVSRFGGRIIKYIGDGSLSIFPSATDAVKAAVNIQTSLQEEPKVLLRIGVHSGDIVWENQDVYGDTVNLASRIETLALPGSVFISDKVFDEVRNQPDIQTSCLGKFHLKHVKREVEVYAVTNEGLVIPAPGQAGMKSGNERSIAVLPFINMSADPENEYFSDGISEEILNALTRVEGLRVTARSSSFAFKGRHEDVREIGNRLGVSSVLTGSVRKAGKRIRITAQLINAADGYHVWSEVYDSDLEDVFEVQDEISLRILKRLKEDFSPVQQKEQIVRQATENIEAYNQYLKGRYYWNKSTPEDIGKAILHFEESIQLDPGFPLPYCALSFCYSFMGSAGLLPPAEAYPKAKDYTLRAIELDPNHAESHLSLAAIKFYHNWDFEGAGQSLEKALSLSLNSSMVNQVHGWYLIATGEFDKAIEKMEEAVAQDPLSIPLLCNLADAFSFANRFEEAIAQYEKALELDPNCRRAYEGRGLVHLIRGEKEAALRDLEQYQRLTGSPMKGLPALGHAYALTGQPDKAREFIERLKQREKEQPGIPLHIDFAFLYLGLKDYDKAFYYLNKGYEDRMGIACLGMIFCIRYPLLRELQQDPRFRELTGKMGIIA